jgi:hypothetical protein
MSENTATKLVYVATLRDGKAKKDLGTLTVPQSLRFGNVVKIDETSYRVADVQVVDGSKGVVRKVTLNDIPANETVVVAGALEAPAAAAA